jgi:hypothetical protein
VLTLAAPPVGPTYLDIEKKYTLEIAPCTRYYVAGDRVNPLQRDWSLVIEMTEPVAGCDPAEELRKAQSQAGISSRAVSHARSEVVVREGPA